MRLFDIGILDGDHISPMHIVIHQRTSTWWTHCVTFKNDQGDIWDPRSGGIHDANIRDYGGRRLLILRYRYPVNELKLMTWMQKTVYSSEGYDIAAMFGFLTGIQAFQDENRWFCSELSYWLFQENGYPLTREEMTFMYPSFFYFSTDFELIDDYIIPGEPKQGIDNGIQEIPG
jgi:hypothetical protein